MFVNLELVYQFNVYKNIAYSWKTRKSKVIKNNQHYLYELI